MQTEEEASFVYHDVRGIEARRFTLLKWIFNNVAVCNSIPGKDRSDATNKTLEKELHTSSHLRLQWKVEAVKLEVCSEADEEVQVKINQRAVLAFVFSFFGKTGRQWDLKIDGYDQEVSLTWANELN